MAAVPRWFTVSAASVLGLGVLASGAAGIANAMPLTDASTASDVPPISTVPVDAKSFLGFPSLSPFPFSRSGPAEPGDQGSTAASSPSAVEITQAPAPAPQPVRPAPTASESPLTPPSPASIDSDD